MAISDKVIDLAPVNKTRKIIMFVALGVAAAAAIVFLLLYILKPSVTPVRIDSLTLNMTLDKDADDKYTVSEGCVYSISAEVGTMGNANATVDWEFAPSAAVNVLSPEDAAAAGYDITPQVIENGESRILIVRTCFQVRFGYENTEVRVSAKCNGDGSILQEDKFTVVKGVAGSLSLKELTNTGNNAKPEVLPDGDNYKLDTELIFYAQKIDSPSPLNNYTLTAEQLGLNGAQMNNSSNNQDNYLAITSSNNNIILPVAGSFGSARFRLVGAGEADVTVTANTHNGGTQISKTLHVKVVTSESKNIISKYYFYADENVVPRPTAEEATAAYYDQLDKGPDKTHPNVPAVSPSITLFRSESIVLEDHMFVRPYSRLADFGKTITVKSTNNTVVSVDTDKLGKHVLKPNIPGEVTVTVEDNSALNAGASISFKVRVESKAQKIAVKDVKEDNEGQNNYTVASWATQNGTVPLVYTFDNVQFDRQYTDCDLAVFSIADDNTETPYDSEAAPDGNITFPDFKGNVISVSNEKVDKNFITSEIKFKVGKDVKQGTYRFKFVAGGGTSFTVKFDVAVKPDGIRWKAFTESNGKIFPDNKDVLQFATVSKDDSNRTVLTLNKSAVETVSVSELIEFTVGGSVNEAARKIGAGWVKVATYGSDFTISGSTDKALFENKIVAKSVTQGMGNYVTVQLTNDSGEKVGDEITLYVCVVDNVKDVVVGRYAGSQFNAYHDTRTVYYGGNTTAAYNSGLNTPIIDNSYSPYLKRWSESIDTNTATGADYAVHIELLENGQHRPLDEDKTGDSIVYKDGAVAIFKMQNGQIYALQDFYVVKALGGKDYSEFRLQYVPTQSKNATPASVDYILKRQIDALKLYTDSNHATEGTQSGGAYTCTFNHNTHVTLHVFALFEYFDTDKQTLYRSIDDLTENSVNHVSLSESSVLTKNVNSLTSFTSVALTGADKTQTGRITYSIAGQTDKTLHINVTVQNKSAPVASLKIYTDGNNKTQDTELSRTDTHILNSQEPMTVYYTLTYESGVFETYEPINFILNDRLQIGEGSQENIGNSFGIAGSYQSDSLTKEGKFVIRAVGGQNGVVQWKLHTPSEKEATYTFAVTTYLADGARIEFQHTGVEENECLAYSGTEHPLANLTLVSSDSQPKHNITVRFPANNGFPVDVGDFDKTGNYTYSYRVMPNTGSANDFVSVSEVPVNGVVVLQAEKVGSGKVELTFTDKRAGGNAYTVTFTIEVVAELYVSQVKHGNDVLSASRAIALSVDDTNETDKYTFEVVLNDGDSNRQPAGVVTAKLYQNGTEAPNNADISLEHYTITYKKNLTSLVGYQLRVFYDGTSIAEIPITLAKGGYVVSFGKGSESAIGSEMDRPTAKVKQYNGGELQAVTKMPEGFTLTYSLKDANGLSLTDNDTKITLSGKSGSATLVATFQQGDKIYATAEMLIYLDNSVHSIDVTFDPENQLAGNNDVVWLKVNTELTWTTVTVKNQAGGTPYMTDYTVQVNTSTAQSITSWTPSDAGVYTLTFTADGVSRTVTVHVIEPQISVSNNVINNEINAIENDTVTFTVSGLGVLAGKGSLTVTETTATKLFTVNGTTATATKTGTATFTAKYMWGDKEIVSQNFDVEVTATGLTPTFAAMQKVGNDWVPVSGLILYTDMTYRFVRTDNGKGNLSFTGITGTGDNTNGYTFSKGNITVGASVTLYGVTFNATNVTYTVKQRDTNAIAMTIDKSTAELFYATGTTKNTVTVTLTNNSGETLTTDDFKIVPSSNAVTAGTPSYSNGVYSVTYTIVDSGSVTFNGSVRVGGKWLTDSVTLKINEAPSGAITATYRGGNINPNDTVNLKNTVTVNKNTNITSSSTTAYAVIAGNGLVESLTDGVLKFRPCTSGGKVTVKVSVMYTDGYFNGQTFFDTFDVTVNTIAAPTASLSYAAANVTATKDVAKQLTAPTVNMSNAGGSVSWTYSNSADYTVTTNDSGTFVTVKKYGSVTVTATGTVSGGAWDGHTLTVNYTITVPDVVEVTFSDGEVTPNGTPLVLGDKLTVTKNGENVTNPDVTYRVSGTAATLSGNGTTLIGNWVSRERTVVVTATVTVDGVQYVRAATFTVLGLVVRDAAGNVISAGTLYIAPSNSVAITAMADGGNVVLTDSMFAFNPVSGVTFANGKLTAGVLDVAGVTVTVSYTRGDGKTYRAQFNVKNPPAPSFNGSLHVGNTTDNVAIGSTKNVTVDRYEQFTLSMPVADGRTAPYIDGYAGNALNVVVTKSGNTYTMTFDAVRTTETAETVVIKFTENGSVYTLTTLTVTVNAPAAIGNIELKTKPMYTINGESNVPISQFAVDENKTYTYSFTVSGGFRYLSFEYTASLIEITATPSTESWQSTIGSVYDFGKTTLPGATFTVKAKKAGSCNLRITVGNTISGDGANSYISAPSKSLDMQIVTVNAFTENDIELPATIAAKTGDTVSIVPTLKNGFIADKITYSSGNGTVTTTGEYTVTVYAAGVSQTKPVTVTFYAEPTLTVNVVTADGVDITENTLTVDNAFSEVTVMSSNPNVTVEKVTGGWKITNTTTVEQTGVVFTVYGKYTDSAHDDNPYNGLTYKGQSTAVTIGAGTPTYTEPSLTVTVNADTNTLTISDDFTEVVVLSSNPNVTVKNDNGTWTITNATLDPQNVTFTVYGKYQVADNKNPYNGRIYQGTCTETIKADKEKAFTVEVKEYADKSGGVIEVSFDPRLKNARYEMSFTVEGGSDLSNYLLIEDGSTIYTYNTERANQNDVKIKVTITLIVNETPREQTVEATITVPAVDPQP